MTKEEYLALVGEVFTGVIEKQIGKIHSDIEDIQKNSQGDPNKFWTNMLILVLSSSARISVETTSELLVKLGVVDIEGTFYQQ